MKRITALLLLTAMLFAVGVSALADDGDFDHVYRHGDPTEMPVLETLDETIVLTDPEGGSHYVTIAEVFQVSPDADELLWAVSLTHSERPEGIVEIATGLTDPEAPDSGYISAYTLSGCDISGDDYTFFFDEPVLLERGSCFSVIFSLAVTDGTEGLCLRSPLDSCGGESFIVGSDNYWYDISAPGEGASVFCIGAYADVCSHNWYPITDTLKECVFCGKTQDRDYAPDHFSDVKRSSVYYDAIVWALENGITAGTDSTRFSPNKTCTRAQIVTFLWRAAGCPEPETANNPFADVRPGDYYKAILWAAENGITTGTDSTHFSPNKACTRAEIVTFLWRAVGSPDPGIMGTRFLDVAVRYYWYKPMLWAVKEGVTTGTDIDHFSPDLACTRAQAVTFLYRAIG